MCEETQLAQDLSLSRSITQTGTSHKTDFCWNCCWAVLWMKKTLNQYIQFQQCWGIPLGWIQWHLPHSHRSARDERNSSCCQAELPSYLITVSPLLCSASARVPVLNNYSHFHLLLRLPPHMSYQPLRTSSSCFLPSVMSPCCPTSSVSTHCIQLLQHQHPGTQVSNDDSTHATHHQF